MSIRRPPALLGLAAGLAALTVSSAYGLAVYGGAVPLYGAGGCVRDVARQAPSERRCPGAVAGLLGAGTLALSPDGRNLYVASTQASALVALSRNPATGGLHPPRTPSSRDCLGAPGQSRCAGRDASLSGADAVAVSPDGRFVYAGGADSAAVSAYARGRGGLLTPLHRVVPKPGRRRGRGASVEFGCVAGFRLAGTPGAGCAARQNALVAVAALTVSPDGRDVYAVSYGLAPGEDSIVALARDPRTGALSPLRGPGGCYQSRPALKCAASAPGLEGAHAVIVSPDGRFVYVASTVSSAVASFQRNRFTGRLRPLAGPGSCVSSSSTRPAPARRDLACGVTVPELGGARALALSPDGRELYVAAFDPGAVVALARDPANGRLTALPGPPLCLQAIADDGCGAAVPELHGAAALAASPDGSTVWVAAQGGDSILALRRDPANGSLTLASSSADASAPVGGPDALVATPDGRHLYVASPFDDAVAGLSARG